MSGIARKENAMVNLLEGKSIREAAAASNISERQIYRWLGDPEYKGEIASRQAAIIESVNYALISMANRAVNSLGEVLDHPEQRAANVKRLAACSILDQLLHFREYVSFESRIARLESGIDEK